MRPAALCNPEREMPKATFLTTQLRESVPYLRDAGFRETANLLTAAADEIEALGPARQEARENERPHWKTASLQ
jgi:hypothetical protein